MLKNIIVSGLLASAMFGVTLEKVWESEKKLITAESVIFDTHSKNLFVANINGKPTAKDGNGFISQLDSKTGTIKKLHFAKGLDAPKGMAIQNNKLFVSDIATLRVIDLMSGKIIKNYPIDEALFLNDVVVANDGTMYVSDFSTGNNKVYKIDDDEVSVWLDSQDLEDQRPNGLWIEDGRLVVGTKSGTIFHYDFFTKKRITFQKNIGVNGIDGILPFEKNSYITSDWAGRVFVNDGKNSIKINDTTKDKINGADIWYDKDSKMLYVPTFFDDRVMAYKIR